MAALSDDWSRDWLVQIDIWPPSSFAEEQHDGIHPEKTDPHSLGVALAVPRQGADHARGTGLAPGTHHEDLPEQARVEVTWRDQLPFRHVAGHFAPPTAVDAGFVT